MSTDSNHTTLDKFTFTKKQLNVYRHLNSDNIKSIFHQSSSNRSLMNHIHNNNNNNNYNNNNNNHYHHHIHNGNHNNHNNYAIQCSTSDCKQLMKMNDANNNHHLTSSSSNPLNEITTTKHGGYGGGSSNNSKHLLNVVYPCQMINPIKSIQSYCPINGYHHPSDAKVLLLVNPATAASAATTTTCDYHNDRLLNNYEYMPFSCQHYIQPPTMTNPLMLSCSNCLSHD
ncbi:unnamed protein product [Schistosoma turkestanicum]|nr:unnamed protein product [Schistosoma turkestanicum]